MIVWDKLDWTRKADPVFRAHVITGTRPLVRMAAWNDDEEQEAWLAVIYAYKAYDPDKGPWGPYAKRAIFMRLMNHRRRMSRWQKELSPEWNIRHTINRRWTSG